MKTKIEIKKCEWVFQKASTQLTVRWEYLGRKQVSWQTCKEFRVSCIIYNDGSGLLNRVCEDKYITTLQPNYGNSIHFLKLILKAQ